MTEFWHAEMEIAWAGNEDVMVHGEGVVRQIARTLLDERSDELTALGVTLNLWLAMPTTPTHVYDTMRLSKPLKGWCIEIEWGQDLDYSRKKGSHSGL